MLPATLQRGYLPSRDTLLNSLLGEANRNNVGATMVWEWIAWYIDDSSYSFDTSDDGSNGVRAQINYMRSKVPAHISLPGVCNQTWTLLTSCQFRAHVLMPTSCSLHPSTGRFEQCTVTQQHEDHAADPLIPGELVPDAADGECHHALNARFCQRLHQYASLLRLLLCAAGRRILCRTVLVQALLPPDLPHVCLIWLTHSQSLLHQWYTSYHTSVSGLLSAATSKPLKVDGSWLFCRSSGTPAAQSHGCNIHTAIRSAADARPAAAAALTTRQTTPSHAMSR